MASTKSQIQQNQLDWFITFAALALIVFICVGFYYHTHPNIETKPAQQQETIDYTL